MQKVSLLSQSSRGAATPAYKALVQRAGGCSDLVAASILDGSFTDTEMKTNTYLERNSREI